MSTHPTSERRNKSFWSLAAIVTMAIAPIGASNSASAQGAPTAEQYAALVQQYRSQYLAASDTNNATADLIARGEIYAACLNQRNAIAQAEQALTTLKQMAEMERSKGAPDTEEQSLITTQSAAITGLKANSADHCPNLPGLNDTTTGSASDRYDAAYDNFVELSNAGIDYNTSSQDAFNAYDELKGCGYLKGAVAYVAAATGQAQLMRDLAAAAGSGSAESDTFINDNANYLGQLQESYSRVCYTSQLSAQYIDPAQEKLRANNDAYVYDLTNKLNEHMSYANEAATSGGNYLANEDTYNACVAVKSAYLNAGWALEDLRALVAEARQSGRSLDPLQDDSTQNMQAIYDDSKSFLHDVCND